MFTAIHNAGQLFTLIYFWKKGMGRETKVGKTPPLLPQLLLNKIQWDAGII